MIAVAIDGPAGAGKSTIARALAKRLGYIYVDTGALYRAVGYFAIKNGADTTSESDILRLLPKIDVALRFVNGEQRVFLNGEDVSDYIRTPEMSMAASNVSALPAVRDFLFSLQQNLAKSNHVVMDGRDIGTVVLPDAQVKIFLTAAAEDRAGRRQHELQRKGLDADYNEVLKDVVQRDYNDSHRAIAPLKQADDAILVDTTGNTKQQSIDQLISVVEDALSKL
ncbi:cytidylate kinase [Hydrogenoanaerobacterium saccharovorans]|uniref:Cytidylate kinase n=1 Tax=Hydrogenoanaerobacterium saccharovorans TaxID=474960 RepID=A0A1H7ZF72_9FIRM|nr:(d)CMP kinase [Hydrogenoanaerobacterium saccharovorans]RPF48682.1 cytidylate kinase [Hydrogenoanaerobacterium saccharovorans]SEM56169.1 cytidylate kinase [Hydrogenoanaerobacterium saccharovorans]